MKIAIIILAAGASTRMKTVKQLLPIGNSTLLGLSIKNALRSSADKVFCVLGANAEIIHESIQDYNIQIVRNNNYKNGLSSSILEGIKEVETKNFDAALIMLGDQPKVSSEYIDSLIASYKENPTCISVSDYSKVKGVPAIFPKPFFEQLKKLKGDKGAYGFLNNTNTSFKIIMKPTDLQDIDTPEDYKKLLKR